MSSGSLGRRIASSYSRTYLGGGVLMAIITGALGAGLTGLVLERTIIRPLHGRDVLSTLLATLGVSIIIQNATAFIAGPDPVPYAGGIAQRWTTQSLGYLSQGQVFSLIVSLGLVAVASFYVRSTKFGRATRAMWSSPR